VCVCVCVCLCECMHVCMCGGSLASAPFRSLSPSPTSRPLSNLMLFFFRVIFFSLALSFSHDFSLAPDKKAAQQARRKESFLWFVLVSSFPVSREKVKEDTRSPQHTLTLAFLLFLSLRKTLIRRNDGHHSSLSFRAAFYFERERDKDRAKTLGNI